MSRRFISVAAALASIVFCCNTHAGISLNTTRVVFNAQDKEASFSVTNEGSSQILLQSWLEANDNASDTPTPFAITPPLARMTGHARQQLRILFQGAGVPTDRESVFWINTQEIPQATNSDTNTLQLAIRQRIKLFYRPDNLKDQDATKAPGTLKWTLLRTGKGQVLQVENPSSFHVSMTGFEISGPHYEGTVEGQMVAPAQTLRLPMQPVTGNGPFTLKFTSINDYGGRDSYSAILTPQQPTLATPTEP